MIRCRQSHYLDGGQQVVDSERFVNDMRLCDLAWAVDDALFDAGVMHNETLVVSPGTAHVAGWASQHLLYGRGEGPHERGVAAYPGRPGGVALRITIAQAGLHTCTPF